MHQGRRAAAGMDVRCRLTQELVVGCPSEAGLLQGRLNPRWRIVRPSRLSGQQEEKGPRSKEFRRQVQLDRNPLSCLQGVLELPSWEQQTLQTGRWMPRGRWRSCSNCSHAARGGCNSAGQACLSAGSDLGHKSFFWEGKHSSPE